MTPFSTAESPLEEWPSLGEPLGIRLLVKRDDLLPFPLAGNKFRKLVAEQRAAARTKGDTLVSNGAVDSNHCRTLALMGRRLDCNVHLVLHAPDGEAPQHSSSLAMLGDLNATFEVVGPDAIGDALHRAAEMSDGRVHVVPGGAHTRAGLEAYRQATIALANDCQPDWIVFASGTGATHAGIALGARLSMPNTRVKGISVARPRERGTEAVLTCVGWMEQDERVQIDFDDRFTDGGYGMTGPRTHAAVSTAWRSGLPLDGTYTGKAFRGLIDLVEAREIRRDATVLFWHTGGLMNYLNARTTTQQ